ncbi:MAG: hypothetical protein HWN66_02680 [Candidatus Helarchaeota archaeon]|nr:hypothetical protein [Candidatus Helarchaeota archaeon]
MVWEIVNLYRGIGPGTGLPTPVRMQRFHRYLREIIIPAFIILGGIIGLKSEE